MQGKNYQIDLEPLLSIPIIQSSEARDSIAIMTELIVKYKPESRAISQIAEIIDHLVYELYFYHHFVKVGLYESEERLLSNHIHTIMNSFYNPFNPAESANIKVFFDILDAISKKWNCEDIKQIKKKMSEYNWIRQIEKDYLNF